MAPIRISLTTKLLTESNVPRYEALSYTWGSPLVSSYVHVERFSKITSFIAKNLAGRPWLSKLPVAFSLEEALHYLRYQDKPRVLWIDALCINQQDLGEKSAQVQRMADIYSKAARVTI